MTRRRWGVGAAAVAVVALVAGLVVWLQPSGGHTYSAESTMSDCLNELSTSSGEQTNGQVGPYAADGFVVGTGSYAGVAVLRTGRSWQSCFDGLGTGVGPIPAATMRASVSVVLVLQEPVGPSHQVLALLHHSAPVTRFVVSGPAKVLGQHGSFELVEVPAGSDVPRHPPWNRPAVTVAQVVGYDRSDRVVARQPIQVCSGAINFVPGGVC